jgi:hypothetical protein
MMLAAHDYSSASYTVSDVSEHLILQSLPQLFACRLLPSRLRDIPVAPNLGTAPYFEVDVVAHNDARVVNSNFVIRMTIPKNLSTSPVVVKAVCFK